MSKLYILNCLQEGGVQFGGVEKRSSGLTKASVNEITSVETFLKEQKSQNYKDPVDPYPQLHNERLNPQNQPILKQGQIEWRNCKIIVNKKDGDRLISSIQLSMKILKDQLMTGIKLLANHYGKIVGELRKTLENPGDAKLENFDYFNTMKHNVNVVIPKYNKISEEYRRYINELQTVYNNTKMGLHPLSNTVDPLGDAFQKIGLKLNISMDSAKISEIKKKYATAVKDLYTKERFDVSCKLPNVFVPKGKTMTASIVSVNLSKREILCEYYYVPGKNIYERGKFDEMCIIDEEIPKVGETQKEQQGGSFESIPLFRENDNVFSVTSEEK